MNITFHGAARQVSGSMFLLETHTGYKILIDCGADLSKRPESETELPFNVFDIDTVLLTHAHVDHSGKLPLLIHQGYCGQILCTSPTYELTKLLLSDSAMINTKRIQKISTMKFRRSHTNEDLSFLSMQSAADTMDRFVTLGFHHRFEINKGIWVTFIPTGHLLGAANIFLEIEEEGKIKTILFSGDLGRKNYPLLPDPSPVPQADYLICEATYGNRSHTQNNNAEDFVEKVINETCVEKSGRLIIPAFSVGRTQSILYTIFKLHLQGRLPKIKIFTDSPMAEISSKVYENYIDLLNPEAQELFKQHHHLFDFENLRYIESFKESKAITNYYEPCIIISSSGMITGGRMQMHIKNNVNNPYCTIMMIGYAAEGTPGHKLQNGSKYIRIDGRDIPISARIVKTDIYSGHADREDLMEFVKQQDKNKLKKIFLVHGEYTSMQELKEQLNHEGYSEVEIPAKAEAFVI